MLETRDLRLDSSPDRRALLLERRHARAAVPPPGARVLGARARAELLCDAGSFTEFGSLRRATTHAGTPRADGDGVVAGWGTIDGRPVVVVSHDFSLAGGSIGAAFAEKVMRAQQLAMDHACPIVYLNDSGGARITEGIEALHGCGGIMANNVRARTRVPQLSLILGPCAGAAAYSPALTDWTIMTRGGSQMFLTGPDIVRAATGEIIEPDELGGSHVHATQSGVAHLEADDETHAIAIAARILSYLPRAAGERLPLARAVDPYPEAARALPHAVPDSPRATFDMRTVLDGVLDADSFFELMSGYAPSILTGLARIGGIPVGVVASQPRRRGGILDSRASRKAARFVSFCGRFGLPVLTFVDVPGFLPGSQEERRGIITHGATLLAAYVEAAVPKLTVIVRKAYGGAYIAMGARSLGADVTWAWPGAEIAVMGPEAAVGLLHRRELAAADDPDALRRDLSARYRDDVSNPFRAAETGIVDDVILPEETRDHLLRALALQLSH